MDSEPESPENGTLSEEIANLPQSLAFTVHFDNVKPAGETTNKFARRHIRNLSLPISKVYENKVNNDSPVNGRATRKAGNHSEGYFSSDPEDDSKPKLFEMKLKHTDGKGGKSTNAAQERRGEAEVMVGAGEEQDDDTSSDVVSETGTYTIDKDSPEVTTARNNIDTVFGVQSQTVEVKKNQVNSTHTKSTKVTQWLEHSTITTKTDTTSINLSKIPSPVNMRSRLPLVAPVKEHEPLRSCLNRKSYPAAAQELTTPEPERDKWAKETERTISVLQARVSQSLDSGGESDAENSLHHVAERRDSGGGLRYNRSVSLRRERLQEPKKNSTSSLVTNKTKDVPAKAIPPRVVKRMSDPPPSSAPVSTFARTDCGRFSMRSPRPLHQAPVTAPTIKKEPVRKLSIGGGRSNSTLSSKEKEYQNWKKRKSYDPMKAAAEGKKKEAAKKQVPSAMTQSTNSTITTPKSPVNPVLRSASFHGTHQLTASSSEEEEEEITLSNEDEDWPVLQVPRSSLENTPQGSRVSLYSNTSNSPTPPLRNRPKLEGVDTLVISALAGLSSKLKGNSCSLLNKLRFLYDEDSPKNHQLSAMIDQLEASEPGSPQVKSPSRELATTLRNLKRLESMLKVLDNVLFDEEEFQ
ncbi:uncharacterized protein LOC128999496 isoform X2 [Macrosteles quadrilineatus]|uniref:uncharacterized protein LOC128999496 isoform X2 n=1 Tax=Macrosteles quadrilineatus TaxID=74068 RepID=UPI0023E33C4E|nr:uncharacterized protein LOC128999496 isoform X2 [Macrosteles quadrilineatus]